MSFEQSNDRLAHLWGPSPPLPGQQKPQSKGAGRLSAKSATSGKSGGRERARRELRAELLDHYPIEVTSPALDALVEKYIELAAARDKLACVAAAIGAMPADLEAWRAQVDGCSRLTLLDDALARLGAGAPAATNKQAAARLVRLITDVIKEVDDDLAGEAAGELDALPAAEQPAFNALVALVRPLRKLSSNPHALAGKLNGDVPLRRGELAHLKRLLERLRNDVARWIPFHEEIVMKRSKRSVQLAATRNVPALLQRIDELERAIEETLQIAAR